MSRLTLERGSKDEGAVRRGVRDMHACNRENMAIVFKRMREFSPQWK